MYACNDNVYSRKHSIWYDTGRADPRRQKEGAGEIARTISLIDGHHKQRVPATVTDIPHDHPGLIISTTHVRLHDDHCLGMPVVCGNAGWIKKIADGLMAAEGVKHERLTVTTAGRDLPA